MPQPTHSIPPPPPNTQRTPPAPHRPSDIRKLDYAKRHLTSTITSLRRLAMLTAAVDDLEQVCVCVCVCACVRACVRACVCVLMCTRSMVQPSVGGCMPA